MTTLFHCKPISNTAISRAACGARHERKIGQTCATCAVGRQHARGALPTTWPDGSQIVTALVTPATLASLKIHLAIIEAHDAAPLRGVRVEGETLREHAERGGVHPQVLRSRINRGEDPATAIEPRLRGMGRHPTVMVRLGRETMTLRALGRRLEKDAKTLSRWLKRGMSVEEIVERCA